MYLGPIGSVVAGQTVRGRIKAPISQEFFHHFIITAPPHSLTESSGSYLAVIRNKVNTATSQEHCPRMVTTGYNSG